MRAQSTLAPTLRALGNMKAVTPALLDTATRQLLASRIDGIDSSSGGGEEALEDSSRGRAQPPAALAVLRALLGARLPLSPRMAAQLLRPLAAKDPGHAPRAARTLRLAVGGSWGKDEGVGSCLSGMCAWACCAPVSVRVCACGVCPRERACWVPACVGECAQDGFLLARLNLSRERHRARCWHADVQMRVQAKWQTRGCECNCPFIACMHAHIKT